ncbi:MAG: hypothetical protein KAU94_04420 [Verrucomicrobia bacterium]|nr:hypothetical protein [Verrucomicrobiota bacterium]
MKKTFELTHPKIKYPRLIEGVKNDVRKYIKRERRKELPEEVDFWDFDCRFGDTEAGAKVIHLSEMDKYINDAEARGLQSFYIEILAKPGIRTKKPRPEDTPKTEHLEMKKFGAG